MTSPHYPNYAMEKDATELRLGDQNLQPGTYTRLPDNLPTTTNHNLLTNLIDTNLENQVEIRRLDGKLDELIATINMNFNRMEANIFQYRIELQKFADQCLPYNQLEKRNVQLAGYNEQRWDSPNQTISSPSSNMAHQNYENPSTSTFRSPPRSDNYAYDSLENDSQKHSTSDNLTGSVCDVQNIIEYFQPSNIVRKTRKTTSSNSGKNDMGVTEVTQSAGQVLSSERSVSNRIEKEPTNRSFQISWASAQGLNALTEPMLSENFGQEMIVNGASMPQAKTSLKESAHTNIINSIPATYSNQQPYQSSSSSSTSDVQQIENHHESTTNNSNNEQNSILVFQNGISKNVSNNDTAAIQKTGTRPIETISSPPTLVWEEPQSAIKKERVAHALEGFEETMDKDFPLIWRCICGHFTTTKCGMLIHIRVHGTDEPRYKCMNLQCERRFNFPHLVRNHMMMDHQVCVPRKVYSCEKCYNVFTDRKTLMTHVNTRNEICISNPRRSCFPGRTQPTPSN